MLDVSDLHVYYGLSQALFGVSLRAERGELIALVGRNGAGKSTTLKAIVGLCRPRRGRVVFGGRDVTGWPPYRIARAGIGYVPEDRRVFRSLTVQENLEAARLPERERADGWTMAGVFELFPDLARLRGHLAGRLSGGQQQMLTIGRALMTNPDLLLLDEPSEGLAPLLVQLLAERVALMKERGLTIVLSEQNVEFVRELADRVYTLEKGEVRYEGRMQDFLASEEIARAYLGV
ncbi:MAG: ABC transporter ATP-binding protein [Burkholderiales bacterium]|nr:ABC transporter ATP-binding protein [Burkholderiales bacterium]